jgi:hypothetical protein
MLEDQQTDPVLDRTQRRADAKRGRLAAGRADEGRRRRRCMVGGFSGGRVVIVAQRGGS